MLLQSVRLKSDRLLASEHPGKSPHLAQQPHRRTAAEGMDGVI